MIFVTLGTQKFQLNRLLKLLDDLCRTQKIKEEIFAQIGHSDYCPMHYNYIDLLDKELFEKKVKESSLVISHGGAGSIMSALKEDKPVIVFPRLRKYREHVDDHQLEIAGALSKKKIVLLCGENDNLYDMILKARKQKFNKYKSSTDQIVDIVRNALKR